MSLAGKVAVVTGSGNGIGRATALMLAARGAVVGVNDLKEEFVAGTVAAIAAAGGRGVPLVGDIGSRDGMRAVVLGMADGEGRLDILVNNAAWNRYQAIPEIAENTVERMLRIGFGGVIWGVQAAAEAMGEGGGAIVNVASIAGLVSSVNSVAYSGIKAGVIGITRAAAAELGPRGIRVNAVAPSAVPTEGTAKFRTEEKDRKRVARTPLGRLGTADDIARAICFLAGEDGGFVTGQVLAVDGGITTSAPA